MKLRYFFGLVFLTAVAVSAAHGDTLLTVKEGNILVEDSPDIPEAMRSSLGGDDKTIRYWLQADRMARVDSTGRMIGRLDRGESYFINDESRSCYLIRHKSAQAARNEVDATPEFRKTGEIRQIGSWQAEGYELAVAGNDDDDLAVKIWVSDEVSIGLDDYRKYVETIVTPKTAWTVKALELGGYPVRQEVRIGPILAWAEILSVGDEAAPPGTYEVPAGYSGCD
jgi:Domain of unknown function (DUF4412)